MPTRFSTWRAIQVLTLFQTWRIDVITPSKIDARPVENSVQALVTHAIPSANANLIDAQAISAASAKSPSASAVPIAENVSIVAFFICVKVAAKPLATAAPA